MLRGTKITVCEDDLSMFRHGVDYSYHHLTAGPRVRAAGPERLGDASAKGVLVLVRPVFKFFVREYLVAADCAVHRADELAFDSVQDFRAGPEAVQ